MLVFQTAEVSFLAEGSFSDLSVTDPPDVQEPPPPEEEDELLDDEELLEDEDELEEEVEPLQGVNSTILFRSPLLSVPPKI